MRPYRKERLASLIQSIIAEALLTRMNDPRFDPLTTVTRVNVTNDLQIARVYLSVPGGGGPERRTMAAIHQAAGYLKRLVAEEISLRQCPQLTFEIDEINKKARHTLELIAKNKAESESADDFDDEGEMDDAEDPSEASHQFKDNKEE